MKTLYKFNQNYGRMGDLEGIFIAEDSEVAKAIGRRVYFGEVLGKHSEIYSELQEDDIKALTTDAAAIEVIEKYLNGGTGWNPMDYVQCPHNVSLNEAVCEECCCEHGMIKGEEECAECK